MFPSSSCGELGRAMILNGPNACSLMISPWVCGTLTSEEGSRAGSRCPHKY